MPSTLDALTVPRRAFGSRCAVWTESQSDNSADVTALWATIETSWSRFRDDSDLSRINANSGSWVEVPAHLADAIRFALELRERSGGLFDPTVSVARWGYERDFALGTTVVDLDGARRWRSATVDVDGSAVRVESGSTLDLGGIGKGLVADMTCALLVANGAERAVVDLGGDIAVAGAWCVDATDDSGASWARWSISSGGVATSSTTRKRWRTGTGAEAHHLIDPRTGAPADSRYSAVSAHASSAAAAEVAAKIALVAGDLGIAESLGAVATGLSDIGLADVPAAARPWVAPVFTVVTS